MINYLDWEPDEKYKGELKRKNRNLKIDSLLLGKHPDELIPEAYGLNDNTKFKLGNMEIEPMRTMGLKMKTKSVDIKNDFVDEMKVFHDVKKEMIKLGNDNWKNHIKHRTKLQIDLTDDSENGPRKALSQMIISSNLIATGGRIGPASHIFMDRQMINYISRGTKSPWEIETIDTRTLKFNTFRIVIDPNITNETVAWRIGDNQNNGMKLVTFKNKYAITKLGWAPELQYVTIDVIR